MSVSSKGITLAVTDKAPNEMKRRREIRLISLAVLLTLTSAAQAAGLGGGLDALGILVFLLLTPFALAMLVMAHIVRANNASSAGKLIAISLVATGLLVSLSMEIQNRPLIQSFNPWWNYNAAILATVCWVVVVGNVFLFASQFRRRIVVVSAAVGLIAVQFLFTPGRTIYYEHDPFSGSGKVLDPLDELHANWDGRILEFEARSDEHFRHVNLSPKAAVNLYGDGTVAVSVSVPNEDPRLNTGPHSSGRKEWAYWFPLQPTHKAVAIATDALLLEEDWQANAGALIDIMQRQPSRSWIETVIARGADPNFIDENGQSPLLIAASARSHNVRYVHWLVELGADPNLRLDGGDTVLHRIAQTESMDSFVARALVSAGTDPTLRNDYGWVASQISTTYGPR